VSKVSDRVVVGVRRVHGKGRVTIPKEVREALGLKDGDLVYFVRDAYGAVSIEKAPPLVRGRYRVTAKP